MRRDCEAGEEPSHTKAYGLGKTSSPSPQAVLPKCKPPPPPQLAATS